MNAGRDPEALLRQLGEITRRLHEALQQLGVMPQLQRSVAGLPDARRRLDYIAHKSGDAAERVLGAVEQAQQEQQALRAEAQRLLQVGAADPAAALHRFAAGVEAASERTGQRLTDIMLAQDFHDLTGQVLAKVVALVVELEDSLHRLQVPPPAPPAVPPAALAGPALGGAQVLRSQGEIDALLAQFGV